MRAKNRAQYPVGGIFADLQPREAFSKYSATLPIFAEQTGIRFRNPPFLQYSACIFLPEVPARDSPKGFHFIFCKADREEHRFEEKYR